MRRLKAAALTLQAFFVILAFAMMVLSSYIFVSSIERKNLRKAAESTLAFMQTNIEADIQESEILMSAISYTILGMITTGEKIENVYTYMEYISNTVVKNESRNLRFNGFCGFFYVFNDTLICDDGWKTPDAYDYRTRPWYKAATEADGKIALTDPFISLRDSSIVVSQTRQIKNKEGKPVAIINLDIQVSSIANYIINTNLAPQSYGVLHDRDAVIIAHPNRSLIGQKMSMTGSGVAALEPDIMQDGKITEREVYNHAGEKVIVFMRTMENGWIIGVLTPKSAYYSDTRAMAQILIILGALLAAILNYILLRITRAKRKADEFMQVMFNASPHACHMWGSNRNIVTCNDEAVRMFGASDKKDFQENFFTAMPEQQPDGRPSTEAAYVHIEKAFSEGYNRFEWLHRRRNGEMLPCEITLIRTTYKGTQVVLSYVHDLSEQKAALQKIREADMRAQVMLDATPLSADLWNKELQAIDCNQEAVRLFELSSKKEYLSRFHELSPEFQPDGTRSSDRSVEYLNQAFDEGYLRFNWEHQKLDGEKIPSEVTLVRVRYKDDFIVAGYTHDLRELNAAIAKMREADERTLAMLNAAPIGITLWDRNFNLIDFNYEASRVVGIFDKQEYRERFMETAPEYQPDGTKTAEKLVEFINRAFAGESVRTLWHHNHINGETIPFDALAVRLHLKYKGEDVIMVCCSDMREINAANAKMRESDERAKIMLDATPVSCTLYDENNVAIDCNQEALKLLGASSKKEYLNNRSRYSPELQPDGRPSTEKGAEFIQKAIMDGFCRFEWTHLSSSGDPVPTEITLVRVKYRGNYLIAAYARDLRELKAMIKEMHRAEIAEESNRAKSRFLAAMSHEIRTPMNVILGVTEIQLQDETLAPHVREAFVQVYNSGDLLLGIINDILDLSKIEADRMEFSPVKYELANLINDSAHLNIMRNSKPIVFELNVDENAPAQMFGDELRIKQILNNLLSNAFKFTDEGTVRLDVSVEPEDHGAQSGCDSTLLLTIADTGQGMTPDQIDHLFAEYTRFNVDVNRSVEGTGLGMNITHRLVSMMDGKITVESEYGKGTTVRVCLPQKRVGGECIGKALSDKLRRFCVDSTTGSRTQFTREYMPYGKVLIVDDVESNLYVARGLMAPYGLAIDIANSGFEAIEKIKAGEVYDIIFMDHMMPQMDGLEAARLIRAQGYTQPMVALTANAVIGQAEIFMTNGFDDFISKPIDIRQLNSTLNRLVRDKQTPETLENAQKEKLSAAPRQTAILTALTPELLSIFAKDVSRVLPSMETAAQNIASIPEQELRLFTTNLHGMRSALANIGEARLSQMALSLEKAGKSGNRSMLTAQAMNFINALRGVAAKAEEAGKVTDHAKQDEDPALLKELMGTIAEACKEYDSTVAFETLERLNSMSWTAETREALEEVSRLLLNSEFDDAAEMAGKLAAPAR